MRLRYICESLFDSLNDDEENDDIVFDVTRTDIDIINKKDYENNVSFTFCVSKQPLVDKFIDLLKDYCDIVNGVANNYEWGYRIMTVIKGPMSYNPHGFFSDKNIISTINYRWEMNNPLPGEYADIKEHVKDDVNNSKYSSFLITIKWSFDDDVTDYEDFAQLIDNIRYLIKELKQKSENENLDDMYFGVMIGSDSNIIINPRTYEITPKSLKRTFINHFGDKADEFYQTYINR